MCIEIMGFYPAKGFFTLAFCFYFGGFFTVYFFFIREQRVIKLFCRNMKHSWSRGIPSLPSVPFYNLLANCSLGKEVDPPSNIFFCCSLFEREILKYLVKRVVSEVLQSPLKMKYSPLLAMLIGYFRKILGVYAVNLVKKYSNVILSCSFFSVPFSLYRVQK